MKDAGLPRRKTRRTACREEAAFLDLLRTTDVLSYRPAQVLKTADLSATQYNVLRILRGAPEGLTCGEVANRMITRDPDITRLLDRLEKRALVKRRSETSDRRTWRVILTRKGEEMLKEILPEYYRLAEEVWGTITTSEAERIAADLANLSHQALGLLTSKGKS